MSNLIETLLEGAEECKQLIAQSEPYSKAATEIASMLSLYSANMRGTPDYDDLEMMSHVAEGAALLFKQAALIQRQSLEGEPLL